MGFKRIIAFIIACVMLASVGLCAFASGKTFSAETFSIDLPDGMQERDGTEYEHYSWVNTDSDILISVKIDENVNDLRPSNVNLSNYENSVARDMKKLFKDIDMFTLQDVESVVTEIGNYNLVKTVCKMNLTVMGQMIPTNMYIYIVITENYVHYFYIMSIDGGESHADSIARTIVINDDDVKDGLFQRLVIGVVLVIVAVVVVGFGRNKKKKRRNGMSEAEERAYLEQQALNRMNDKISDACQYSNTDSHEEE